MCTDVCAFNGGLWCPKAQSNIFVPSSPALANAPAFRTFGLRVQKNVGLFLKGPLRLYCQFGSHYGGVQTMRWKC